MSNVAIDKGIEALEKASLAILKNYYALGIETGHYKIPDGQPCTEGYLEMLENSFLIASKAPETAPILLQSVAWTIGEASYHPAVNDAVKHRLLALKDNVKQCLVSNHIALPLVCEGKTWDDTVNI